MRFTFATCPSYLSMIPANKYAQHANLSIKQCTQINATSLKLPPEGSSDHWKYIVDDGNILSLRQHLTMEIYCCVRGRFMKIPISIRQSRDSYCLATRITREPIRMDASSWTFAPLGSGLKFRPGLACKDQIPNNYRFAI